MKTWKADRIIVDLLHFSNLREAWAEAERGGQAPRTALSHYYGISQLGAGLVEFMPAPVSAT